MALPSSTTILTTLFSSLNNHSLPESTPKQEIPAPQTIYSPLKPYSLPQNPLLLADKEQIKTLKPLLTTLHLLYPNEFLPALDLIDRGLITRLVLVEESPDQNGPSFSGVYNVRSAATARLGQREDRDSERWQTTSTGGNGSKNLSYEVRLKAWNCSCPAFVFDFVNGLNLHGRVGGWEAAVVENRNDEAGDMEMDWQHGGLRNAVHGADGQRQAPICKHLLACSLVECCPLFKNCIDVKKLTGNEIAAWAAGWGD